MPDVHFTCQLQYWRFYLLSLVLGIGGSFQYGIHVSLIASPAVHIQSFVNYTWMMRYNTPVHESTNQLIWSFIVAVLSLGCWAGAVHSGSLPVTYGRKKALLFNNMVAVIAALLMVFSRTAKSFEMILLGRFLYGYNIGLGLSVHLMYLSESSPKKLRGFLTLTSSIFIGLGKVVGQIIGIKEIMGTDEMWPYLLGVSGIPAILQFVMLLFFPKAPRYLYIDKGDTERSKKALQWLWQEENLKMELNDMQLERERSQGEKAKTVKDVLTSSCVRWQLLTLAIPCAGVQFCGINAVCLCFSADTTVINLNLFKIAVSSSLLSVILLFSCTSTPLTSSVSLECHWYWSNRAHRYNAMSGVSMVLPADLFLQAWRPSAYVVSGTINWLGMFVVGMLFGYIVDGLGQFCFLIFVAYSLSSAAFVIYFVPETKRKTMIEIMEDFNRLNYKNRTADTENTDVALETKF